MALNIAQRKMGGTRCPRFNIVCLSSSLREVTLISSHAMQSETVLMYSVLQASDLRRQGGFALLKVVFVIAILGILIGSALPAFKVYQQRAYASEASLVLTQILHSQSAHFHQHDRFYPKDGQAMTIFHGNPTSDCDRQALENALGIDIPSDDLFDYHIQAFPGTADDFCVVMVSAPFPLFTDGTSQLLGLLNKDGRLSISSEVFLTGDNKTNKEPENGNNRIEVP